jgi:hypothetical protein
MKNKNEIFDLCPSVKEMSETDLILVTGGKFAYDIGFFIREMTICFINGAGVNGTLAVATDLSINYKP